MLVRKELNNNILFTSFMTNCLHILSVTTEGNIQSNIIYIQINIQTVTEYDAKKF